LPVTRLVAVDGRHPDPRVLEQAAACLQAGELVAFPTDTVYGLGCDAASGAALAALYRAKQRPRTMPLIILLARAGQMAAYARGVPPLAEAAAGRFWPGPLTIIVPAAPGLSRILAGGGDSIGLRVPEHAVARALAGMVTLASTSANRSGRPAPTTAAEVMDQLAGRIHLVLDAGPVGGQPSTVVDFTTTPPRLLRPGPLTREELEAVVGPLETGTLPEG